MAGEQRKLAHASKRDSSTMKTISLLGSIFLPGAYLAVSRQIHDKLMRKLIHTVNLFNNILQLSERTRFSLSGISKLLALGSDYTSNLACCGDLDFVG